MTYHIEYNGKFIASRSSMKGAMKYIEEKGLKDDEDNVLRIWDAIGNLYNPVDGKLIDVTK